MYQSFHIHNSRDNSSTSFLVLPPPTTPSTSSVAISSIYRKRENYSPHSSTSDDEEEEGDVESIISSSSASSSTNDDVSSSEEEEEEDDDDGNYAAAEEGKQINYQEASSKVISTSSLSSDISFLSATPLSSSVQNKKYSGKSDENHRGRPPKFKKKKKGDTTVDEFKQPALIINSHTVGNSKKRCCCLLKYCREDGTGQDELIHLINGVRRYCLHRFGELNTNNGDFAEFIKHNIMQKSVVAVGRTDSTTPSTITKLSTASSSTGVTNYCDYSIGEFYKGDDLFKKIIPVCHVAFREVYNMSKYKMEMLRSQIRAVRFLLLLC